MNAQPNATTENAGQSLLFAPSRRRMAHRRRPRGKILTLVAILLPSLCGMIGLVVDGGMLLSTSHQVQHIADSAATAAAMEKQYGQTNAYAKTIAEQFVKQHNGLTDATVTLYCPPISGAYAGQSNYVEVNVQLESPTYFMHIVGGAAARQCSAKATAGFEPSTAGAAVVVLDPDPPPFSLGALGNLPLLPSLPAILGGMEVLGVGSTRIDGAVLVNTKWGGMDENREQIGNPVGLLGLSHAISTTPVISLSKLRALDIRTVGGVDDPKAFGHMLSGNASPLKAGRLAVPDPFKSLPAPTIAADAENVKATNYGGVTVIGLPIIGPPVRLRPGVYDYIDVVSGVANFDPGVYIIRGVNPVTQISLSLVAGQVKAEGVMFYITDSGGYSPASGSPDASDGDTQAPAPALGNTLPAAVINIGLLGSSFSGLSDADSPFNNMLIYQRRHDRRPIVLVQENILGAGQLRGTVYSKWGHVILAGKGTYDARFVVGTMRIVALLDMRIQPSTLLPPAYDVYLVE